MKTGKVILGIIGALLVLIISQMAAQLLASLFMLLKFPAAVCNAIAGVLYVAVSFLLLKIFAEKGLKVKLPELGIPELPNFKIERKWLVTAFLLPLAVNGIYFLFPGELRRGLDFPEAAQFLCAGIFFIGLAAGTVEEMVFRGFIMNLLDKRWGKLPAVLLPSLLFGAVHILGMGFGLISCIQVVVAGTFVGIMFSLVVMESRSVWNSAVIHVVWNIITSGGLIHVGEAAEEHYLFSYVLQTKSFAVTGGEFGLESSVISIAGYAAIGVIAYLEIRKRKQKDQNTF